MIRSIGTVFYSLLYSNSLVGLNGLKYVFSVISVIENSLPGNTQNTKNRESTRSWTERVRVEFLLKTESGYLRDAEVTLFTLANP